MGDCADALPGDAHARSCSLYGRGSTARRSTAAVNERMLRMRDFFQRWLLAVSMALVAFAAIAGEAAADGVLGMPREWEIDFQPAYSPVMEQIQDFNYLIHTIIIFIVALVLSILVYVIFRFNARRNPVPSKTSHNTLLEVAWTVLPVLALVVIVIPSLKLLYFSDKAEKPDMTLKVTGHQWYWSYNYPDHGEITFDSIPIPAEDLQPGQPRLLAVDNPVVVPVNANVQVLVNSDDVIHNWAVPSLALKKDATPGRTNETWFRATQEGIFYGMCSELCGVNHYFMPIEVRAVSKEAFDAWVEEAKQKFAANGRTQVELASSGTSAR
jgi:cytochrome c oxidase subunit II